MDVKLIAVRSDGERFMYESEDWGLTELKGLEGPEISVYKESRAFGHGAIITGVRKSARAIELKARLRAGNNLKAERRRVIGFHNANYTYTLEITYMGETKRAKDCVLSAMSYPSGNVYQKSDLEVMFESPYADLFAESTDSISFVSKSPMWHDTRVYEPSGSLAFGEIVRASEKTIYYDGSEPAPIVVNIKANGYVNGMNVEIGDAKLKVSETLNKGDTLLIDAASGSVLKNDKQTAYSLYDQNALKRLMLNWGDNTVKIASGDNTAFTAEVEYEGRYGGL